MTTIAVTRNQIAGDLQLSHASGVTFKAGSKLMLYDMPTVYKVKFAIGYAGNVDTCFQTLEFFTNPDEWKLPKSWQNSEFVVLTADHKIYTFSDPRKWLPVGDKFYSIGSGSHFAMGAMQTGASAIEAVKVATKLDKGTGKGVSHYDFT